MDEAGTDGGVADAVDEDEAAQGAAALVGLEGNRLVELELAYADVVQLEALRRGVLERVDVDAVLEGRDRRRHGARPGLHEVGAPLEHRLLVEPYDGGL